MLMRNGRCLIVATVAAALSVPVAAQQQGESNNTSQTKENQNNTAVQQTEEGTASQNREESGRQTTPRTGSRDERGQSRQARFGRRQQRQLGDQELATWVLASTEAEIKISELVAKKAQNEKVKAFAQKMVKEHTALAEKLRPIAGGGDAAAGNERERRQPTALREQANNASEDRSETRSNQRNADPASRNSDQAQPGTRPERAIGQRNRQMKQSQNPAVALHEEIAQKYAQSTVQAMQQASEGELGAWYLGQTLIAHMNTKAALEAVTPKASPKLQPVLQEASQTIDQHMQEALKLMGEIGNSQNQSQQ